MIKLVTIWMISSLVIVNRQELVERQNPRVLKNVCLKTYRMDYESIYTQTTTYDSLVLKNENGFLKLYYYLGDDVDSSKINTAIYDTLSMQTELMGFQQSANFLSCETISLNQIQFPVYHHTLSTCPDPQCRFKHGHISTTSKSWYSTEFGKLIESSVNSSRRPSWVTILIGFDNNLLSGKLVHQLMVNHFSTDNRIFQKYQADFESYYPD